MTKPKLRGFTLVEVLVALFVMAIMAALAWRGLDGLMKSREIAQGHVDQTTRLETVLQQFDQDMQAVQDNNAVNSLSFDGATLRMTRRQPSGMQVVAWTLHDGNLYRWAGPVVQDAAALSASMGRSQQFADGDSQRVTALVGVSGWQIYFYRGNSWTNAQSSGNVSTSDATTAAAAAVAAAAAAAVASQPQLTITVSTSNLPDGVRMVLQFAPGSGFGGPLTQDVLMAPHP